MLFIIIAWLIDNMNIKDELTKAFYALKELDYLTQRDLACCRSCALHEVPDEKENLFVFTTTQDEQEYKKTGACFISWSAPDDNPKEIIRELKRAGLKVKHDKSPRTRIFITNLNKK